MKPSCAAVLLSLALAWPAPSRAAESFESIQKLSEPVVTLKRILLPFVATCDREKNHFRKLFCSALNERLKAQHQSKTYFTTVEPSAAGPLIVTYRAKPKPTAEITVRGCLTCKEPLLEREGGDISKARFFLFKTPKEIKGARGKSLYDLGEIDMATYTIDLGPKMTEKRWTEEILPFIRLDLLFRPVAGVTQVGGGKGSKYKHGVITFELVAHRVYDRCSGRVLGTAPRMSGHYLVDKTDLSCPQNQPKKIVARPKLPPTLPQASVRTLMEQVSEDLRVCYEQFGETGDVPADLVVSPKGMVTSVTISGKLTGTPTSQCVERLIKETVFPRFTGAAARLRWPLSLRN
jgi:hypothetical protein